MFNTQQLILRPLIPSCMEQTKDDECRFFDVTVAVSKQPDTTNAPVLPTGLLTTHLT